MQQDDLMQFLRNELECTNRSIERLRQRIDIIMSESIEKQRQACEIIAENADNKSAIKDLKSQVQEQKNRIEDLSADKIERTVKGRFFSIFLMFIGGTTLFWLGSLLDSIGKHNAFIHELSKKIEIVSN